MSDQNLTQAEIDQLAEQAEQEGYPFLFSVVMAIYNAQDYVAQAIESVVGQTIGFDRIQLVLVDDGSSDGSLGICKDYERKYSDNIVVVAQENAGVSAARNAGIALARGKYLNFLDSDDKWSEDAFAWAAKFFQANPDVRMAASKYVLFDAKEGKHRLNYKFKETTVIDLTEVYDYPQLSSSTCFFEAGLFQSYAYSSDLSVSEDTLLVNQILLEELEYGVMSEPVYYYRQHQETDSAIDTMRENKSWYFDTPTKCYKALFELSKERHGKVLPFIQFTVMYDLQWRIRAKRPEILNDGEIAQYRAILENLLADIEDHIVSEQRTISIDQVAYAFCLKYGVDMDVILDNLQLDDGFLTTHIIDRSGTPQTVALRGIDRLSDQLSIVGISFSGDAIEVIGFVTSFRLRPDNIDLQIYANNKPVKTHLYISDYRPLQNPFDEISGKTGFAFKAPIHPGEQLALRAEIRIFGKVERPMRFRFEEESGLSKTFIEGEYAVGKSIEVLRGSFDRVIIRRYEAELDNSARESRELELEAYKASASTIPIPASKAAAWAPIADIKAFE